MQSQSPPVAAGCALTASLFDVSVEVISADAPFLADLVGLQVAASDPVAHRPIQGWQGSTISANLCEM